MSADFLSSALATMLVIINPFSLAPIFLGLTQTMDAKQRAAVAVRAVMIAAAILIVFAFFGAKLLKLVGIGIPAFRIAGGLLLFSVAFEMLFDRRSLRQGKTAETAVSQDQYQAIAAFPLAIPLMAGPGAITAAILLASRADGDAVRLGGLVGVIILVLLTCYVVLRMATSIARLLGVTGTTVLSRLLGVLLSALAVQFIIDGIRAAAAA